MATYPNPAPLDAAPPPPNPTDPAFAGTYGYRALGAYSSGLDTSGNAILPSSNNLNPSAPNLSQQQAAQGGAIWDAQTQTWRTANPNPVIDAAQNATINDATRFEDKLGLHSSPVSTTLRTDRTVHQAANNLASGNTVICTELMRRGDASMYDLVIEYRFVDKIPAFIVRGYRIWAIPYVAQMRKSSALYDATRPFAEAFIKESAAILGLRPHSILGMAVIGIGLPICAVIGAASLLLLKPCEA